MIVLAILSACNTKAVQIAFHLHKIRKKIKIGISTPKYFANHKLVF